MASFSDIVLRDYQQECVDALVAAGDGSHLVVMATGLGKTVTFAHMPRLGRMLILSHRDELVRQPQKYFDCPFGIEKAGETSDGEDVVSASVQTLSKESRLRRFEPGEFDVVVTDEAHHAIAPSYRKVVEYLEPRVHIGFTATPNRDDGRGLNRVFDDIVFERDLKWGIQNGYLSDIDCRRVLVSWKTRGLKSQAGDFALRALSEVVNTAKTNVQVAAAYEQYAVGQTLVFASSVDHAYALSELIRGSRVVDGRTPVEERRELIAAFTNREIPALINFGVFTEGTDLPLIETVLLARPTKNQALYAQMVGRGLRLAPGKPYLRLIDCMGVSESSRLCTAPSLFGFNEDEFSPAARKCLDGSLLNLEARLLEAEDTPSGWVLRDRKVDLLERDKTRVAWVRLPGNKRSVSAAGFFVELHGPDALGACQVVCLVDGDRVEKGFASLHDADGFVYNWLLTNDNERVKGARSLWDSEYAARWGNSVPSEKQLVFLANILPPGSLKELDEIGDITKRECAMLIEYQLRKNSEKMIERVGRCPLCGSSLSLSKSGGTWQCSTNKYRKKDDGGWERVSGCGFHIMAKYRGKVLDDATIRSLIENGSAPWRGGALCLSYSRSGSYLRFVEDEPAA